MTGNALLLFTYLWFVHFVIHWKSWRCFVFRYTRTWFTSSIFAYTTTLWWNECYGIYRPFENINSRVLSSSVSFSLEQALFFRIVTQNTVFIINNFRYNFTQDVVEYCRFQLLDYHDGSYVLRLRLWSSCLQMVVNIHTPDGVPLCDSPNVIKKGLVIINVILS